MLRAADLPTEVRILLHLFELTPAYDLYDKPIALAQDGIATAVRRPRSSISRRFPRLEKEGLVQSEPGHVEGSVRKRRIYTLTDDGLRRAADERNDLLAKAILANDERTTVEKLWSAAGGRSLLQCVLDVLEPLEEAAGPSPVAEEQSSPVTPQSSRETHQRSPSSSSLQIYGGRESAVELIGRGKVLATLIEWLRSPAPRPVLALIGHAGIGKSELLEALLQRIERSPIAGFDGAFLHSVKRKDSPERFLQQFSWAQGSKLESPHELLELWEREGWLVILDGLDQGEGLEELVEDAMDQTLAGALLISSRELPEWISPRQLAEGKVVQIALGPLERFHFENLARDGGLSGTDAEARYRRWGGWPLASQLDEGALSSIARQEILGILGDQERATAGAMAPLFRSTPMEYLLDLDDVTRPVLDGLARRGLITSNDDELRLAPPAAQVVAEDSPASAWMASHGRLLETLLGHICDPAELSKAVADLYRLGFHATLPALHDELLAADLLHHLLEAEAWDHDLGVLVPVIQPSQWSDWEKAEGTFGLNMDWWTDTEPRSAVAAEAGQRALLEARLGWNRCKTNSAEGLAALSRAMDMAAAVELPAATSYKALLGFRMASEEPTRGREVLEEALAEAVWRGDGQLQAWCQWWLARHLLAEDDESAAVALERALDAALAHSADLLEIDIRRDLVEFLNVHDPDRVLAHDRAISGIMTDRGWARAAGCWAPYDD